MERVFPSDLSRLLVVRAGETMLAELPTSDGVGRDLLKDYLSGEGLLDRVAGRISRTLQRATVEDSLIDGDRRGELSTLDERKTRLASLQSPPRGGRRGVLPRETPTRSDSRRKRSRLRVETLRRARRYHAGQLAVQIQTLKNEKRDLPAEGDLAKLEQDITACETNQAKIQTMADRLTDLESTSADFAWAQQAQAIYDKAMSGPGGSGPKPILLAIALLLLVGTVASGLLGLTIPLILCGVALAAAAGAYVVQMNSAFSNAGQGQVLSDLKDQYPGPVRS